MDFENGSAVPELPLSGFAPAEMSGGRRPRRLWAVCTATAVLLIVLLGDISNSLTTEICEQETSQWLAQQMTSNPGNAPERRAFAEPAEFRVPWIVAVDYELAISNTGGEWGTRSYVALFGYQILLRKTVGMQS